MANDADADRGGPKSESTAIVPLPLSDSERITYQKAAERCGLSLADWIRDRLNAAAKREAKES
jgi:hypothetical protein